MEFVYFNKQTNYHCMILIDMIVMSILIFFFYFFGIFTEIRQTFQRSVFSARWLFGKMAFRRSGYRQSVVHRSCREPIKSFFYFLNVL